MKFKLVIIFLMFITTLLLIGCATNQFEISNKITPIISILDDGDDDEVSLEYNLGPLLILDVIEVNNKAQLVYLKKHSEILTLDLVIEYSDGFDGSAGFAYYLKGNKINKSNTVPIELNELMAYDDKISGFVWIIKDSKEVNSLSKKEGTNFKPSTGLKKL